MDAPLKNVGAITLFVDDPKRSKAFYEQVLEGKIVAEDDEAVTFQLENTILNLLRSTAANELVAPAAVGTRDGGSRFQLTAWVEDANKTCSALAAAGVDLLNGPVDREWGVRTAAFADPDGHVWEIAQPLGRP